MTISQQPSNLDPNIMHVVDERTLYFVLGNSNVRIIRTQHLDIIDGKYEAMSTPALKIHVHNITANYEICIFESKNGSDYRDNYAYKINAERNRAIKFETIRPMLDEIWAFYSSAEGQREMLQQSINEADKEISELQTRVNLLQNWCTQLRRERFDAVERVKQQITDHKESF